MSEVKGFCNDCLFLQQEWNTMWTKDAGGNCQLYLELDRYCGICDIFKRPDGYCDLWTEK